MVNEFDYPQGLIEVFYKLFGIFFVGLFAVYAIVGKVQVSHVAAVTY